MRVSSRLAHSLGLCALSFLLSTSTAPVWAYDNSANDNLVLYWGQNSFGAANPSDTAGSQQNLSFYCGSDSVTDAFPIAFLTTADAEDGLPSINLANICNTVDDASFPGTELPECQFMADNIQTCQAAGKIVTLSIGGATGGVSLSSDSDAVSFANTIWDTFLGGSSDTRPFGDAVLDGVDLDIEGGGTDHYAAFVTQLRSLATSANKTYYVTAAPQCPFPDANLDTVINAVGFDAIYVQFYNNFCGLNNFDNANDWNFDQWDNWAKTTSPNPDVKIFIGAPASSSAASSGYVDASTLANIIQATQSNYSSFGGVMMWDASQAYGNDRYDISAKNALTGSSADVSSSSAAPSSNPSNPISSISSANAGTSSSDVPPSPQSVSTPAAIRSSATSALSNAPVPVPSAGTPTTSEIEGVVSSPTAPDASAKFFRFSRALAA